MPKVCQTPQLISSNPSDIYQPPTFLDLCTTTMRRTRRRRRRRTTTTRKTRRRRRTTTATMTTTRMCSDASICGWKCECVKVWMCDSVKGKQQQQGHGFGLMHRWVGHTVRASEGRKGQSQAGLKGSKTAERAPRLLSMYLFSEGCDWEQFCDSVFLVVLEDNTEIKLMLRITSFGI